MGAPMSALVRAERALRVGPNGALPRACPRSSRPARYAPGRPRPETIGAFYSPRAAGLNTSNIGQLPLPAPPRPASALLGATGGAEGEAEDDEAEAEAVGALPPASFAARDLRLA